MQIMSWKRGGLLAVSVIAAAATVAACSSSPSGSSASNASGLAPFTMTIGSIEPYTGDLGVLGAPAYKSVKLAVQQLNAAAAKTGVPIKFQAVTADTQTDPQAAVLAARKLVAEGATCLVGPETTPVAIAILNSVTKLAGIPMFPEATSVALRQVDDNHTIFRTVPPDNLQGLALVKAVAQNLGGATGKLVSFAYQNQPYGEGLANAFKAGWTKLGGKIQITAYNSGQADYQPEADKIVSGNPAAWVFADFPDTWGKVARALLQTGKFDPGRLYVSDALAVSPIPSTIPAAALDGAYAVNGGSPVGTPLADAFNTLYTTAPGPGRSALDTNNFDSAILCGLAAVAAKSNSPSKIRPEITQLTNNKSATGYDYRNLAGAFSALEHGNPIRYIGVSGTIFFGPDGDTTAGLYDLSQFKNSTLHLVRQINTLG